MQTMERLPGWRERIERFFFAEEVPVALALIRILLPVFMLTMYLPRWRWCRELYSFDGAPSPLADGYGYLNFVPEFSGPVVVGLFTLMLLAFVTSAIGWMTRLSLFLSCALLVYFSMLDSATSLAKFTVIACHMLLLLAVSPCGSLWSVDAWIKGRRRTNWPGESPVVYQKFSAWPRRLIQLHIALVYFGAAVTKMNTPAFLSGDQLVFWTLTHINFEHPAGEWFSQYPAVLFALGYITLIWEAVFLFAAWKSSFRNFMLPIGAAFHVGTLFTLGLILFPAVMFTSYLAFFDDQDFAWLSQRWRKLSRRHRAMFASITRALPSFSGWQPRPGFAAASGWVWGIAAVVLVGASIELEHWIDPYGLRRPEGPYALTPMDPARIETMMTASPSLRVEDKFFAIDLGTTTLGGLIVDRRTTFRPGQNLIAQCTLVQPHEDMWIECEIVDEDNRLVRSYGQVATREQFRANFSQYLSPDMAPGKYAVVVRNRRKEVLRRGFTVLGDSVPERVAAN